jgi:hypothetical protein
MRRAQPRKTKHDHDTKARPQIPPVEDSVQSLRWSAGKFARHSRLPPTWSRRSMNALAAPERAPAVSKCLGRGQYARAVMRGPNRRYEARFECLPMPSIRGYRFPEAIVSESD